MSTDAVSIMTERTERTEKDGYSIVVLQVRHARGVLEYIAELERSVASLSKEVLPKVGDVIREVGEDDPTGEIIQIKEGPHEEGYLVKLYTPTRFSDSIIYYRDEFEIMERRSDD